MELALFPSSREDSGAYRIHSGKTDSLKYNSQVSLTIMPGGAYSCIQCLKERRIPLGYGKCKLLHARQLTSSHISRTYLSSWAGSWAGLGALSFWGNVTWQQTVPNKKKNWIQDNALPLKRGVQGCCPTMRTVSTFNAVFSVLHPVCSFCQVGDLMASLQNMLLTVSLWAAPFPELWKIRSCMSLGADIQHHRECKK